MRQQRETLRASRSMAVSTTAVALFGVLATPDSARADPKSFAYGEYLSQQCTACHRKDGVAGRGIPPIVGLEVDYFVTTMKFYQTGARDNEAMVSVAKTLDDEALKALAIYFGSLKPAEQKPTKKKR
jgi:cytochrome c553